MTKNSNQRLDHQINDETNSKLKKWHNLQRPRDGIDKNCSESVRQWGRRVDGERAIAVRHPSRGSSALNNGRQKKNPSF